MATELIEIISRMSFNEKRQLVEKVEKAASENEHKRKGCCRNVLAALQTHLGLDNGNAFKAASSLGGGVARIGEVCGTLLGGIMAIGLAYCEDDRNVSETTRTYEEAVLISGELCDRFKAEFGYFTCRDVQKAIFGRYYDLKKPDEAKRLREINMDASHPVITKGARLAAEVILRINAG